MIDKEKYFSTLYQIRQWYKENYTEGITPYDIFPHPFDIMSFMTPIELNVWDYLRGMGMLFYPQYPAGKYFIDFARPQDKIGIEVDGKEWHTDPQKDHQRQSKLEEMGWKIYRIGGNETFYKYLRDEPEEEYLKENDNWYKTPIYKLLREIQQTYTPVMYIYGNKNY